MGLKIFDWLKLKRKPKPEFTEEDLFHLLETIYLSQQEGILGEGWKDIEMGAKDWIYNKRKFK